MVYEIHPNIKSLQNPLQLQISFLSKIPLNPPFTKGESMKENKKRNKNFQRNLKK